MRDIPANIIHERRDALIVLYAVTETTERKCDYLEIGKETIDAFYIELKGIEVDSAYEQLLFTIQNVNVGIIRKKTAIVVTPHIPKSNLKFQKYEKLCHKQGAELKVVNSGCTFHLYK